MSRPDVFSLRPPKPERKYCCRKDHNYSRKSPTNNADRNLMIYFFDTITTTNKHKRWFWGRSLWLSSWPLISAVEAEKEKKGSRALPRIYNPETERTKQSCRSTTSKRWAPFRRRPIWLTSFWWGRNVKHPLWSIRATRSPEFGRSSKLMSRWALGKNLYCQFPCLTRKFWFFIAPFDTPIHYIQHEKD